MPRGNEPYPAYIATHFRGTIRTYLGDIWTCNHEHLTMPEAVLCAGRELEFRKGMMNTCVAPKKISIPDY